MNKRLEVFEAYLDADWRSHETRDELVAAYCFFARTSFMALGVIRGPACY